MRVALARLLLCQPDILLLDEPTNHMDLAAMEWLETYLKAFKGAVLIISHDRTFLDRTATMTAELTAGALKVRPGTYSRFLEIEAAEQLTLARERKKLARELEHQQQAVQTLLSHRKMSSYHAREKVVARLTGQLSEIAARAQRPGRPLSFRFLPGLTDGDPKRVLLAVDDLTGGYTAEPLFSHVSFLLRGRSKTALCGPNGCGKTTLLALLLGRFDAFTGQVRLAEKAVFGHMGQHVDFADETMTVLDELRRRSELPEGASRDLLARYGFRDVDVFKTLSVLSGGERARLYLACLLLEQPSLLLLDEPTNHLDIASREILEQALIDFNGAVLAVSHDRYFIDHCCSEILGFIGDQVLPFASFEAYRQEARRYEEHVSDGERAPAADRSRQQSPRINRAGERRETALRKEHLRQLEKQIREHEDEKTALETGFADDARPETYRRYERILTDLERLYAQYIDLAESET
jgi:ATP-binding cassette subfamily F protein 3